MSALNPVTNYPNGFSSTVTILGVPVPPAQSYNAWWVSSTTGLDGNAGTFQKPFATLDRAFSFAASGDVVYVKANHTETLSTTTALVLDVAGVTVVGLGFGSSRPTFTMDTATTTTVPVSAANITLSNLVFVANFLNIVACFTLTTAADFLLDNVAFNNLGTNLNFQYIVDTDATTSNANGLTLQSCRWVETETTAVTMVKMDGSNARVSIVNNYVLLGVSNNTAALMAIATGKACTTASITNNTVVRLNTDTATGALLVTTDQSTNSGVVADNYGQCAVAGTPLVVTATSGFSFFQNYISGVNGASGFLLPAADS